MAGNFDFVANGWPQIGLLYEAPFTGVAPTGPEALFTPAQVATLVEALKHIRETAVASQ